MSLSWSETDKQLMREAQESHMMDEGYLHVYSSTLNNFGDTEKTYTKANNPTICGLEYLAGSERRGNDMTLVEWEAIIRLPYDFTLDPKDRFEITKYRGEIVSWMYEIVAPIQYGVSGYRIPVNRIEI